MLPSVENYNCYEYLKHCTSIYPDVWMMQHFGVRYRKSEMFREMATVGVAMAALTTAIWLCMLAVSKILEKRAMREALNPAE